MSAWLKTQALDTTVVVDEKETKFTILEGDVSLQRLVDGLNAIGLGATVAGVALTLTGVVVMLLP